MIKYKCSQYSCKCPKSCYWYNDNSIKEWIKKGYPLVGTCKDNIIVELIPIPFTYYMKKAIKKEEVK